MNEIRPARPSDAEDMAEVQNAIHRVGRRASPVDVALVRERYLDNAHQVACSVAEQEGRVVGFHHPAPLRRLRHGAEPLTSALPGHAVGPPHT